MWSEAPAQTNGSTESSNIPKGTKDELEGKMVEHTLKLCEFLESELKGGANNGKSKLMSSHQKVKTPRFIRPDAKKRPPKQFRRRLATTASFSPAKSS
jgi:hypothetical protein